MENIGLKKYAKNLERDLPKGKAYINLCPFQENVIFNIPLIEDLGINYFYNHLSKDENGTMGRGGHISLFRKLDKEKVTNADFSTYDYSLGKINAETELTLNKIKEKSYELKDKNNLVLKYRHPHFDFPTEIVDPNGNVTKYVFQNKLIVITSKDDVVKLHFNSEGFISKIDRKHGYLDSEIVNLDYQDGFLVKITHSPSRGRTEILNVYHKPNGDIEVCKESDASSVQFSFSEDSVEVYAQIGEESHKDYTISYDSEKCVTTVTNSIGTKEYFFFEKRIIKTYYFNTLRVSESGHVSAREINNDLQVAYENGYGPATLQNAVFTNFSLADFDEGESSEYNPTEFENSFLSNSAYIMESKEASYRAYVNGNGSDSFTLTLIAKAVDEQVDLQVQLGEEVSTIPVSNNWKLISVKTNIVTASEMLEIYLTTTGRVIVGAINLFKNSYGNFYSYDSEGNNTDDGNSSFQYKNGKLSSILGGNGVKYDLEYDPQTNDLVRFKGPNGIEVENGYSNHALMSQTVKGRNGKVITTSKGYGDNGLERVESSEYPTRTDTYYDEYDSVKKVISAGRFVSEKFYNEYGELERLLSREERNGNAESNVYYDYFDDGQIKKISVDNGTTYEFTYDDTHKKVRTISLNGTCILKYEYYSNGNVLSQSCGLDGDTFTFEYTDTNNVSKTVCTRTNNTYLFTYDDFDRLIKIEQTGASLGSSVKVLETYTYDATGRPVKNSNDVKEIDKLVDNNSDVTRTRSVFNGGKIIQEHDSLQRSFGTSPESVCEDLKENNKYSIASFVGSAKCVGNSETYTYPAKYRKEVGNSSELKDFVGEVTRLNNIPCIRGQDRIAYQINKGPKQSCTDMTVALWFNAQAHKDDGCIFSTQARFNKACLSVYERGYNHFDVVVRDKNGGCITLLTTGANGVWTPAKIHFDLDTWVFLALSFYYEVLDENTAKLHCVLRINSTVYEKTIDENSLKYDLTEENLEVNFGYNCERLSSQKINSTFDECKLALVAISNGMHLNSEEIEEYFRTTKDYFYDNALFDASVEDAVDCSITNLIKAKNTNFAPFKVFPLENNVFSLDYDPAEPSVEDQPFMFDLRKVSKIDKDRTFNYNNAIKRYAFVSDGNRLSYKTTFQESGTVAAGFCFTDRYAKQYLFDIKVGERRIGLYRNTESGVLELIIDNNPGTIRTTDYILPNGQWYNVALSFDKKVGSDSESEWSYYSFRVIVNECNAFTVDYTDIPSISGEAEILLGGSFDDCNAGHGSYCWPLCGQIKNFAYCDAFCDPETIFNLFRQLDFISKIKLYDEFGLQRKEEISKGGDTLYSKQVDYGESTAVTSVRKEVFRAPKANFELTRNYEYNDSGWLTSINEFNGHTMDYSYDFRGFLWRESWNNQWTEYKYDNNGNITSRNNDTFEYDQNCPDKLIKYNNYEVKYDPANPGNIISLGYREFEYEGRRLKKITIHVSSGTNSKTDRVVTFEYNNRGLRTSKTSVDVNYTRYNFGGKQGWISRETNKKTTNYEYDGDKLVYEKSPSNEVFFLYDESNELYAYILNGTKYFYMKDAFNNFIGLVKEDGTVAARYVYSAFGTLKYDSGSVYNPIRYKGYYYDNETSMFYCGARFYCPEICRWINMDNPTRLKTDDPTKLNLFVYCSNNPVMAMDPTGYWPWGITILAILAVVAVAVLSIATAGVATAGAAILGGAVAGALISGTVSAVGQLQKTGTINPNRLFTDMAFGAISGAFAGAGLGPVFTGIALGITGFASSVVGDLVENDDDWSQVKWADAVFEGVVSGVLGGFAETKAVKEAIIPVEIMDYGYMKAIAIVPLSKVWEIASFFFDLVRGCM